MSRGLELFLTIRLLRRNQTEWQGQVSLFNDDMRSWRPPKLVDILISELLGSFGDNELSPECLDGAQRVLNRKFSKLPMLAHIKLLVGYRYLHLTLHISLQLRLRVITQNYFVEPNLMIRLLLKLPMWCGWRRTILYPRRNRPIKSRNCGVSSIQIPIFPPTAIAIINAKRWQGLERQTREQR